MLRFLTAGESHGPGLTGIVDGLPAGLALAEEDLARDLARRQLGYGRGGRMKIEQDRAEIRGGVAKGLTTGGPIALWIENRDWPNWKDRELERLTVPRPGHADLAGVMKYLLDDTRIVLERASARETAMRVAVGAVARRLLAEFGVSIRSQVLQIGPARAVPGDLADPAVVERVEASAVRAADPASEDRLRAAVDAAKARQDTVGGVFEVIAFGVIPGLGSHVQWDRKLDGRLAQALMSIQAVKAVAIGDGFEVGGRYGTEAHDGMTARDGTIRRLTNRAGGIEGGMTNGEPVVVRVVKKPISTTAAPQPTVDLATLADVPSQYIRSDVCAVPAAAVVGEAAVAWVLADALLEKLGGDSVREIHANLESYLAQLAIRYQRPRIAT
ncbi:MAG: chorismate synthase [Chloroflexi bacterium]|nr:chorismate synthase [Chloroflexota bacterium]